MGGERPTRLPFVDVAEHFALAGLRVPAIYLDAAKSHRLVLLEDLGDTLLLEKVGKADEPARRDWYGAAVELLSQVHQRLWPVPSTCIAASRRFDYDLLRWELDHYREWGAEALPGRALDATLRCRLDERFDALARAISELPLGFVHRDYQSRNLMVLGETASPENLAIIDFQDAFVGPRLYDLVALLNDSYVDLSMSLKEEMVSRYARLMGLSCDQAWEEFLLITVQRKLKDAGRFVFIDRVRGNPSFLRFVDASLCRVVEALSRLPQQRVLGEILCEVDPLRFS
jgi:aminoglycoside/choline kinase family phosphotransferase